MKGSPLHSGTSSHKSALKKSDSPVKHAGHGRGIGMKHHKGRAIEYDIEQQVKADGATGSRYQRRVYGEPGSRLRKLSTKLAKAKKKKQIKARITSSSSGEKWSPGSLIRKARVKNLQKRVDRMDYGGGNSTRGRNPTRSPEFWAEKARQDAIRKENRE